MHYSAADTHVRALLADALSRVGHTGQALPGHPSDAPSLGASHRGAGR